MKLKETYKVQCATCKEMIALKDIKIGTVAKCSCGAEQICIDKDKYISRWKVKASI